MGVVVERLSKQVKELMDTGNSVVMAGREVGRVDGGERGYRRFMIMEKTQ